MVDRKNLSDSATVESEAGRVAGHIGGVLAGALLGGGVFTSGAISAQVEKKYAEDSQNTDALAQALAEGLIVEGRDGWEITEGSEEALAELGLAGDKAVELAEALGDGAEELKEYGKTIAARNAQEEALKEALAASAASAVDATKYTAEEMQ